MAGKGFSENVHIWQSKLNKFLHEKQPLAQYLDEFEKKTNIPRLNLAYGVIAFFGLYLAVGYGAQFICNFVGFLYPAYASIKALESKQKDDDTKWLTYWVVYSFTALLEFFTDIFFFWVPFYWLFKCMFLVFLMVPTQWNGSLLLYERVIRPLFLKHEAELDSKFSQLKAAATEKADELQQYAREQAIDGTYNDLLGSKMD